MNSDGKDGKDGVNHDCHDGEMMVMIRGVIELGFEGWGKDGVAPPSRKRRVMGSSAIIPCLY